MIPGSLVTSDWSVMFANKIDLDDIQDLQEQILDAAKTDHTLAYILAHGIPLTQNAYISMAYFGDKDSIEELEGEEIGMLPPGFEYWPVDETEIN